jgi:hypothetical protein
MKSNLDRFSVNMWAFILICLIIIGISSGAHALDGDWSETQKKVLELQQSYFDFWKNCDYEALTALVHPKFQRWGGRHGYPVNMKSIGLLVFAEELASYDLKILEVNTFGNVAMVYYFYQFTFAEGKSYSGRGTDTWLKQDGQWKIIGSMQDSCKDLPRCAE